MSSKTYTGRGVDVSFDAGRCIHAAECVRRLSEVFDVDKRPWIQPDNASVEEITAVVERCPSGALQYQRHDQEKAEQAEPVNSVILQPDGPAYVRGQIELEIDGHTLTETRLALCRCGLSENKPYCDNSHKKGEFRASGIIPASPVDSEAEKGGVLSISLLENGPMMLRGSFEVRDEAGETVYQSAKAALCRCGGSLNKPFCDGTHRTIGFSAET
jgi:CDGSH-type Zn-finger protein/uncharacterized Fe-S cluster protein YjdI